LWIFERCGGDRRAGSTVDPVMKLDASGKMVANFGGGLTNWPHGFYVDRAGNVWITDGRGENGKGHTVIKFSPQGKILLTLASPYVFDQSGKFIAEWKQFGRPSSVYIDNNDTIYVADSQSDDKTNLQTGHSDWKRQGW
jgi:sugar lactone lactonase YvrE